MIVNHTGTYRRFQPASFPQQIVEPRVPLRLCHLESVHASEDLLAVQAVLDAQRVLQVVVVQVVQELPVHR